MIYTSGMLNIVGERERANSYVPAIYATWAELTFRATSWSQPTGPSLSFERHISLPLSAICSE